MQAKAEVKWPKVDIEDEEAQGKQSLQEKEAAAAEAFDSFSALELIHCSHFNSPVPASAPAPDTATASIFSSILSTFHSPLAFLLAVVNAVAKFVI